MKQKRKGIFGNKHGLVLCMTGMAIMVSACQAKPKILIIVDPPLLKTEKLDDVAEARKDASASAHESARTDWIFSIMPEMDFSIKDEKKQEDGYHIWIEVTAVKLKLALPITTFVSGQAPKYVLEHEQGHVKICRRIYAKCRENAFEAAKAVIGKRFEGFGADRKLALSNALQTAAQEIASPYRVSSGGLADQVSSQYDQLCEKEDRSNLVDRTVDEAFAAVEKTDNQARPKG